MDLFALTRQLIDIPSLTGDEVEVANFLAGYLTDLHYNVELQKVEHRRFNVIATRNASPWLMLSTHMDTVPPHINSDEDEENIYGRGACDAKGIIAAQITAAEQLHSVGIDIGLLFTVDEELGSLGAQVANQHPLASQCRYMINGEPTDNRLATGTKGSLRVTVRTAGRPAHSAYPEQGESAVEKLLDVLASIRQAHWPADPIFGETTCNIGVVAGGTRPNVIAAEAHANLQLRLVGDVAQARSLLEQAVAGRAQLEYASAHAPVHLLTLDGFEPSLARFTTDLPYLSNWGTPLLLGPGSILNAHTDHEYVAKRDLTESVMLYTRLVDALLVREGQEQSSEVANEACR